MDLPQPVSALCDRFLVAAPAGLVTGLYLRGGLAFGEWTEGQSDVDFVAALDHRPDEAEIEQLRDVHAGLAAYSPVKLDGMHVLASDLAADPRGLPPVPTVQEHAFEIGELDALVAWHELAGHGATVHGPDLSTLDIWTDAAALRDHTRENLDTYWRGWAERLPDVPADAPWDWITMWCVLGVARLDHLLVTREMTAKSQAGRWGLGHYPERFRPVLREALRLRGISGDEAPQYASPAARAGEVAAFTAYVVNLG